MPVTSFQRIRPVKSNSLTLVSAVTFLFLLFGYSSIDKVLHYEEFVEAVRSYVLVPEGVEEFSAVVVVTLELMVAIGLLAPFFRSFASILSVALLGLFTIALMVNQLFLPSSICGCWFTLTLSESTPGHIAQNILFIFVGLVIYSEDRARIKGKG
jgi:uncharacterized membrane protein YphA (DoxX/SURF4 family)